MNVKYALTLAAFLLAGCAELIPTRHETEMTIHNGSDHELTFVARMADTQNKHSETFVVAPRSSETKSWQYSQTGSGLSSAWQQDVAATLAVPSFKAFVQRVVAPDLRLVWRGDVSGEHERSVDDACDQPEGELKTFEAYKSLDDCRLSSIWIPAGDDTTLEYALIEGDDEPTQWLEMERVESRKIFSDSGDGIAEGSTYTCTASGCTR